jgi:hypothetical protein
MAALPTAAQQLLPPHTKADRKGTNRRQKDQHTCRLVLPLLLLLRLPPHCHNKTQHTTPNRMQKQQPEYGIPASWCCPSCCCCTFLLIATIIMCVEPATSRHFKRLQRPPTLLLPLLRRQLLLGQDHVIVINFIFPVNTIASSFGSSSTNQHFALFKLVLLPAPSTLLLTPTPAAPPACCCIICSSSSTTSSSSSSSSSGTAAYSATPLTPTPTPAAPPACCCSLLCVTF